MKKFNEKFSSKEHLNVLDAAIEKVRVPNKLYRVTQEKYVDSILSYGLKIGQMVYSTKSISLSELKSFGPLVE